MTQIYGAAVNPSMWADAMDGVAQYCDATAAALMIRHPDAHRRDFQVLSTTLDAATRSPLGLFFGVKQSQIYTGDWNKLRHVTPGIIYLDTELGHSGQFLDKRADYRFLKRKVGAGRRVGVRLSADNAWFEAVGLGLRDDQSQMTRKTRQALEQVLPHLTKATELARLYALLRTRHNAVLGALSHVGAGVAIARPNGEVIYANAEANRILNKANGLRQTENGYLRCHMPRQTARLHAAIVEATHTAAGNGLFPPYQMDVERAGAHGPLLCDIVPMCDPNTELESDPEAALVIMLDPQACGYLDANAFALSYGLNPSETELCSALINAPSSEQMAERLNMPLADLDAQVARLFRSVGVGDRFALLRRIWRVAPVVY